MSKARSALYPTGCGFCGAAKGEPCRSLTTGRVTDTHADRITSALPSGYIHEGDQ